MSISTRHIARFAVLVATAIAAVLLFAAPGNADTTPGNAPSAGGPVVAHTDGAIWD